MVAGTPIFDCSDQLESCETGRDDPTQVTMIGMLHTAWPQVFIEAPEQSARNGGYTLDRRGLIVHSSVIQGRDRRLAPAPV